MKNEPFNIHHINVLYDNTGQPKKISITWETNTCLTMYTLTKINDRWSAETNGFDSENDRSFTEKIINEAASTNQAFASIIGNDVKAFLALIDIKS